MIIDSVTANNMYIGGMIMDVNRVIISKKGSLLFGVIGLLVIRDFLRVLLGKYIYLSEGWTFERYTGRLMSVLLVISLFLLVFYVCIYCRNRHMPQWISISFGLILILSFFWTIHSLLTVNGYSITTFDGTAKTIMFMMLGIYIGYDPMSWKRICNWIPFLALIYILLSAYFVVHVRLGAISGNITNQSPYWMVYSAGFWIFAYYLLCYENKKVWLTFILMSANLLVVSFTISRGWLIQTVFLYMIFFFSDKTFSRGRKELLIFVFVVLLGTAAYFMRNELVNAYLDYLEKFSSLASRTNQFDAFFSQVSKTDLFWGQGEYASYTYKSNRNYIYIDNSYLYYAFHFGSLFMLIMLVLPLKAGVGALKSFCSDRKIGIILFMWIAALNGFSVFCAGYEVSLRVMFIMVLIGRAIYIKNNQYEELNDDY